MLNKSILFFLFLFFWNVSFSQNDSLKSNSALSTLNLITKKKTSIDVRLAMSGIYSVENNWSEKNNKSIALRFTSDYLQRVSTKSFLQYYQYISSFGYMKVIDSIWIKNTDYWRAKF